MIEFDVGIKFQMPSKLDCIVNRDYRSLANNVKESGRIFESVEMCVCINCFTYTDWSF